MQMLATILQGVGCGYNEQKRLDERYLKFNIAALVQAAAIAVCQSGDDFQAIRKLAEGRFNRVFELTMANGIQVIARLPYPFTQPRSLATANEVATMDLVCSHGVPTPLILGYSTNPDNSVGAEYILMEKVSGRCLWDVWYTLSETERVKVMNGIVDQEASLFGISLPAHGSIFYKRDLPSRMKSYRLKSEYSDFCIGPDVSLEHWIGTRSQLDILRSAAMTPLQVLEFAATNEITWMRHFAKPRFPFERVYREDINNYKKMDPSEHTSSLESFLQISAHLVPKQEWVHKPVLRHPELHPINILIDDDCNIVSILDWQYAHVLPLFLHAGIPNFYQSYADREFDHMKRPEIHPNLDEMDERARAMELAQYRRRHTHFHYMDATAKKVALHHLAMTGDKALF